MFQASELYFACVDVGVVLLNDRIGAKSYCELPEVVNSAGNRDWKYRHSVTGWE